MKQSICLPVLLFLSACSISTPQSTYRAVYLVREGGQLAEADLDKHAEILVTNDFEVFKQAARNKIVLWVDKNATQLVASDWITTEPQAYYPIIVIGYNDPLRSFKYSLLTDCFLGPINPDFSDSEPGFSVFEKQRDNSTACGITQGFKLIPTIDDILKVSNALLDGTFVETLPAIVTAIP